MKQQTIMSLALRHRKLLVRFMLCLWGRGISCEFIVSEHPTEIVIDNHVEYYCQ